MPYASTAELPPAVKRLPGHAQDIFRAAFNSAYKQYDGDEQKAFAVAWAAVKNTHEKDAKGEWVAKASPTAGDVHADAPMAGNNECELCRPGKPCRKHEKLAKLYADIETYRTAMDAPGADVVALQKHLDDTIAELASEQIAPTDPRLFDWSLDVPILKRDASEMKIFGWMSVSELEDGTPVIDLQGDYLPITEVEKAAHEAMGAPLYDRHETPTSGRMIESIVMTAEKAKAMGIDPGTVKKGWWVGYQLTPTEWADVQDKPCFSVGGSGRRTYV